MTYTLGYQCAKNCCKRAILVQLIVENVVTFFFGTQCSLQRPLYDGLATLLLIVLCSVTLY